MKIQVEWDNPQKTILRYTFPTDWTWDDFYAMKHIADAMLDDVTEHDKDIVLLFDLRKTKDVPRNLFSVGRRLFERSHPRGNPIIGVSHSKLFGTLGNMLRQLTPTAMSMDFRILESMETAEAEIEKILKERHA